MSSINDNKKILDHYYQQRARHFLDSFLIPLIKKKLQEGQDEKSSLRLNLIVASTVGAIAEDILISRSIN